MQTKSLIFTVLLIMSMLLAACSGGTAPEPTPQPTEASTVATSVPTPTEEMMEENGLPMVDPLAISGDIITAGSSTVFPLTERMVERFREEGYGGNITIDSIGTGGGFERFCQKGETDISNASRSIKEEEVAACQAIGREPIEFRVGTDALAVVVSPKNYFATNLTIEELALAFSTATTWAEVNPAFPAHPIARFSPGTDSGTFDYFVEEVFDKDNALILATDGIQFNEDDNVLVQGVAGDSCQADDLSTSCAIGYFGYAYYQENEGALKIVNIDGVEASAANVDNNSYPLARPLFIYSTANIMQEKPQVAAFINFYLTYVDEEVADVGYFPASAEALELAKQNWLAAQP